MTSAEVFEMDHAFVRDLLRASVPTMELKERTDLGVKLALHRADDVFLVHAGRHVLMFATQGPAGGEKLANGTTSCR